jgi:hypothetical protein
LPLTPLEKTALYDSLRTLKLKANGEWIEFSDAFKSDVTYMRKPAELMQHLQPLTTAPDLSESFDGMAKLGKLLKQKTEANYEEFAHFLAASMVNGMVTPREIKKSYRELIEKIRTQDAQGINSLVSQLKAGIPANRTQDSLEAVYAEQKQMFEGPMNG